VLRAVVFHAVTWAEVYLLNDLGEWISSVVEEDGAVNFGLTVSKSELLAVVGDTRYD
jgi:hypothetical protein